MNRRKPFSAKVLSLKLCFVLTSLCAVTLHGCGANEKEPEPVVPVQVAGAQRAAISETISADAVVFPLEQAVIAPKITSTIRKFYVQRGAHVKQGQLLVDLEHADLAGAAEQSKGEYEQAQAGYTTTTESSLPQQIEKAKLDAAAAQVNFEAQKQIYNARKNLFAQGAIARKDLDAAEVALAQARSQNEQAQKQLSDLNRIGKEQELKSASGQLAAAKGKYLNATAMLSYSEIRSPISGVVTDRPLYDGELATANQPILTVMNTSELIAKAHIPQSEAAQMKVGDAAELHIQSVIRPIKGRVALISPAVDPGSTTIEVWVEAIKPVTELKPGMSVSLEVTAKSVKDAIVVPSSAVFKTPEGEDYVMLAGSDGKAHQTLVSVGIRTKDHAEISSGLKVNDAVITVGGYALPDNTKVTIAAPPAAETNPGKDSVNKDNQPGSAPAGKPNVAPAKSEE